MRRKNRRKKIFANELHKQISLLFLFVGVLPLFIITLLTFHSLATMELILPGRAEFDLANTQKAILSLLILTQFFIMIIVIATHKIIHSIVGPFDRLVVDLRERVKGTKKGPLIIRKGDKFQPLVDEINKLLEKNKSQ